MDLGNMGKNISKNVTSKYSQTLLYHAKQSTTNVLKTASKRAIQKTAEATGVLKTSPHNSSETNKEEMLRERYISPKQRQKIIDDTTYQIIQRIIHLKLEQEIGLKKMMNPEKHVMLIVTLNLKLQ